MATVPETPMDNQVTEQPVQGQVQYLVPVPPPAPIEKRSATLVDEEEVEEPQGSTETPTRAEAQTVTDQETMEPDGAVDATPQKSKSKSKPKPKREHRQKSPGVMMIAASSKSKNVAGYIAQTTRENGSPPTLNCVGPAAVNQAVKAIAIARKYLDGDKVDLRCLVTRSSSEDIKDLFKLHLSTTQCNQELEDMEWIDLKSSNNSAKNALAGAIANNVRAKKRPRVTCIGQLSVFRAVLAVSTARKYLMEDEIDLQVLPEFTEVVVENGQKLNAVQLVLISQSNAVDNE